MSGLGAHQDAFFDVHLRSSFSPRSPKLRQSARLEQHVVKRSEEGVGLEQFWRHCLWQALQAQRRLRAARPTTERVQP